MLLNAGTAVIVESTYGVSKHLPRDQREQRFIEKVRGILVRGGRVLLPVVALGRAQVQSVSLVPQLFCCCLTAVTANVIKAAGSAPAPYSCWHCAYVLHYPNFFWKEQ